MLFLPTNWGLQRTPTPATQSDLSACPYCGGRPQPVTTHKHGVQTAVIGLVAAVVAPVSCYVGPAMDASASYYAVMAVLLFIGLAFMTSRKVIRCQDCGAIIASCD